VRIPLRTRLTLLYLALFAVIIASWSVFVVVLVHADLYAGIDRSLDSRAAQIATTLKGSGDGEFQDVTGSALVGVAPTEATAQLLSPDGTVLESSGDTMSVNPILPPAVVAETQRTGKASIHSITDPGGETFRLLIARLPGTGRLLVVGTSTENADSSVDRLILIMLLTGPLTLLLAGVAGWLFARRALAPVARMTAIAAGVGIESLEERVPVPPGHDELSGLASTLNRMLDRLEEGVRAKRRLVADASHELQTPLAVMRTELDVSLASDSLPPEAVDVLESAREETDSMARIVRNLLTLARFDEGTLRLLRQRVELRALATEVVESLSTLAREDEVTVEVTGDATDAQVDPEYLRVLLVNLVENAIKYSGRGSSVTVDTRRTERGIVLTVADTGPGIPASALPLLFERFYRVESARSSSSGSGLGLAISREIAEAHGGTLTVESELGRGSRFTLLLPAS
jgi:two-component system, OmpR family, sensor kinase